jgi:hypothetical protein
MKNVNCTIADLKKIGLPRRYFGTKGIDIPEKTLDDIADYFEHFKDSIKKSVGLTICAADTDIRIMVLIIVSKFLVSEVGNDFVYFEHDTIKCATEVDASFYFGKSAINYFVEKQCLFVDHLIMSEVTPKMDLIFNLRRRNNMLTYYGVLDEITPANKKLYAHKAWFTANRLLYV